MRALVGCLLLVLGCGSSQTGLCQGNFCGQGTCVEQLVCTDSCKRVPVGIGERCPAGYGCLGFVTCVSTDAALPPSPDFRVLRDMTVPPPVDMAVEDMAVALDDGAVDMLDDASD